MQHRRLGALVLVALGSFVVVGGVGCTHEAALARAPSARETTPAPPATHREVATIPSTDSNGPVRNDAQPGAPAAETPVTIGIPVDPTSGLVAGRSTIVVHAPIDSVRKAVLGFASYADFMPHYTKCKVLGRTPAGGRDVYMEIEALNGAVRMWARIEVPKQTMVEGVETYPTKFIDGNVDDFRATWRLKAIPAGGPARADDTAAPSTSGWTELSLEVYLAPKLPLPSRVLNAENTKGAEAGVLAMRARAEAQ